MATTGEHKTKRSEPPAPKRPGRLVWWLLALLLFALAAHAQPTQWQSYREGFITRYSGPDAQGGQWTGSSYKQWGSTFSEFHGPHGETEHCRSYELSGTTHMECD